MLTNYDVLIRLLLAVLASALIGYEREKTKHAAGLRTHLLVCIGSTIITLTSIDMFPQNPAPITAAIITGIGFLGAGTIFRDKNNVRGLTTAASIWAVAGLGLALGAGAYVIAAAGTLAMMFTLEFGRIQYLITKKKRKWS
ncbi:MgtC/SapB family protein [Candidatus Woesearchaeota archaeon]|nr:MgtC/SapB family protein [Candidatus Woesearchaeota archaeon]